MRLLADAWHAALRRLATPHLALVAALLIAPAAAFAQASPGTPTPPPLPPADELAGARTDYLAMLDQFESLALQCNMPFLMPEVERGRYEMSIRTDEDIAPLVGSREQFRETAARTVDLHSLLEAQGRCVSDAGEGGSAGKPSPGSEPQSVGQGSVKTLPSRWYEDFPRAEYSVICGNPPLDGDAWFAARAIWEAAKLAKDLAHDACEWLVVALGGANASLACIPVDIAYGAAELVFTLYEFCLDDAAYLRAVAVLEDTEHLHTDIEQMQEDVDFIKDAVTCRPVLPLRRGSGCNGNDDDCDPTPPPRTVDECDEDVYGPLVYIPASVTIPWYASLADARAAVEQAVVALDDCQTVSVAKPVITGSCGSWGVLVEATDACGNQSSAQTQIKIDPTPPQVIIPPAIAGTCFASASAAEAAVLAQAIIQDDCASATDMNVRVDSQVEGCSLHVRIEATNPAGLRAVDAVTVRVDPHPPVIRIDASLSQPWFRTMGELLAALLEGTHVEDDCGAVTLATPQVYGSCGSIVGRMIATDACGNSARAEVNLHLDASAPTVVIAQSAEGRCFATVEAAEAYVRSQATIVDDCAGVPEMQVRTSSSVTSCGLRVTVEAIDPAGHRGADAVTVRVDATPPSVLIDRMALGLSTSPLGFQSQKCFATAAAAETAVLMATVVGDDCTPGGSVTKSVSSSGPACALVVTARATDSCGQTATDSVKLRVDVTPPSVTCAVTTNRLTPADKRMVDVGFGFTTSDGCDGANVTKVITVTSDEQTWGGGTSPSPDAEILYDTTGAFRGVRLRAECNSPGDGRVYRIKVTVTDACGNTAFCTALVNVPNTSGQNIDSGQNYDAAAIN